MTSGFLVRPPLRLLVLPEYVFTARYRTWICELIRNKSWNLNIFHWPFPRKMLVVYIVMDDWVSTQPLLPLKLAAELSGTAGMSSCKYSLNNWLIYICSWMDGNFSNGRNLRTRARYYETNRTSSSWPSGSSLIIQTYIPLLHPPSGPQWPFSHTSRRSVCQMGKKSDSARRCAEILCWWRWL